MGPAAGRRGTEGKTTLTNLDWKEYTMTQRTLWFIALTIVAAALTTNIFGGARDDDGSTKPMSAAAGANPPSAAANKDCDPVSYNRSVDSIGFSPDTAGGTLIELGYSLRVGDSAGAMADLSADILVEVIIGGVVVSQTTLAAEYDFVINDAVLCATSTPCASACGSIFGDGKCVACDCKYERSATLPGGLLAAGDVVRATILPLAVAAPELRTDDDVLEVTIGTPSSCCPWDTDGDGLVGIVDFLELLAHWGPCP